MKKIIFSLLLLFGLLPFIQSQTVDSIKVEQAGDLIKIHYKILNSKPDQVFRVSVLCSINGGLQSVIKSLSGDFGDNVVGGRSDYMVLWDVLKDVDEVKSVDFSVRAELLKDEPPKGASSKTMLDQLSKGPKKRFHLMVVSEIPGPKLGVRIGFMGSWGFSVFGTYGKTSLNQDHKNDPAPILSVPCWGYELTKRIVYNENIKLHLMAGMTFTKLITYNQSASFYTTNEGYHFGTEAGTIIDLNRLTLSLAIVHYYTRNAGSGTGDIKVVFSPSNYVNAGIGIRF